MRNALILALLVLCVSAGAHAVPSTLSYQGILTDPTGQPVTDGAYSVTFSIFNSASGGSALWTEAQTVSTLNGLLSTTLGQVSPIPDTAVTDTAAYLQIAVASDPPMSPRTRLSSVPYSILSSSVRGAGPVFLEIDDVDGEVTSTYELSVSPAGSGTSGHARKNMSVIAFDHTAAMEESLDLDAGYVTNLHLHDGDDTLSLTEIAHLPGAPGPNSGMAVAIPAFMKNARKAKTAVSAESREILDTDSGYAHNVLLASATGTTERSLVLSPPDPSSGVAIPKFLDYMKHSKGGATAAKRETLDVDSGNAEIVTMQGADFSSSVSRGTSQTREHVLLARQTSVPGGGTKTRELSLSTDLDSVTAVLTCVSETGGTSEARKGANESAAISSLRTLVTTQASRAAMKTDTAGSLFELESTDLTSGGGNSRSTIRCIDLGPTLSLGLATPTDSSDVEVSVTDTEQSITLSTTTSAAKWPNIVLKRGLTASEMTISHESAGASSVIHASVDGAVGAQLGINTATPTLAFQLVGSGCYSGTFGACSDRRFKDQITTLSDPMTAVQKLRGVNFSWKQDEFPEHAFPDGEQLGLIAQEVEAVLPSVVSTGTDGYKSVDYAKLVPLLIEAVKDQQRQIDNLRAQLEGTMPPATSQLEMER